MSDCRRRSLPDWKSRTSHCSSSSGISRPLSVTSLWALRWTPPDHVADDDQEEGLELVSLQPCPIDSSWPGLSSVNSAFVLASPRMSPSNSSVFLQVTSTQSEKGRSQSTGSATTTISSGSTASSTSWTGFSKIAKLLNQQKDKERSVSTVALAQDTQPRRQKFRRTLSLEKDDETRLCKASSIDSLVDPGTGVGGAKGGGGSRASSTSSCSLMAPMLSVTPSSSVSLSVSPASCLGWGRDSVEHIVDGFSVFKADKKKLERLGKVSIHTHALFLAVEHCHADKAKTILETTDVDVNSLNGDLMTPLDVAILTQNEQLVKLLVARGARHSSKFKDGEHLMNMLGGLVVEAEKHVGELNATVSSFPSSNSPLVTTGQQKECEKQLFGWERRLRLLKSLQSGYNLCNTPQPPTSARLQVVGSTRLRVDISETTVPREDGEEPDMVTRYKIQWSRHEDFTRDIEESELCDLRIRCSVIEGLVPGARYFVRVAAGNVKGYGEFTRTTPNSASVSVWRDVDGRRPRSAGRLATMEELFRQIRNSRSEYASEIRGIMADQMDTPVQQRKNQMKKSIKSLFTPAPKFFKHLKRGVFLASILYCDDKVLVTAEETVPIVEVDEATPSGSLHADFHWLMKVACTWDDVKCLRQDMDKNASSSTVHFRSRLLQAAAQMQSALGLQDLGQLFYKPLKDSNGTIVISTVNHVRDPKTVNSLSMKWISVAKVTRKVSANCAEATAGEILVSSITEQIKYNHVSSVALPPGLYLGYLKLMSTMDLIRVLVPERTPNVLPYARIRSNPHVSSEEWEWLTTSVESSKANVGDGRWQLGAKIYRAAKELLDSVGTDEGQAANHRIYDVEIIELSEDVSFILILPPVESVCSVPGQNDELVSKRGFVALPVQIFEMVHMSTYHRDFIGMYSRLSSILEIDTIMAHHAQREAFLSTEVAAAKLRLSQLHAFQLQVDNTWKGMRWIMDVLTYARDKQANGGVSMSLIFNAFGEDTPRREEHKTPGVRSGSADSVNQLPVVKPLLRGQMHHLSVPTTFSPGCERHLWGAMPKSYSDTFSSPAGSCGSASSDISSVYGDTGSPRSPGDEDTENEEPEVGDGEPKKKVSSGVLRIYAAYRTGLASGTSVKVHVTPKTTARNIVELVVTQLSLAAVNRGVLEGPEPVHADFCLVAVVGARERCFRDDFRPLHQLHSPWAQGKLYVRMRADVLAALGNAAAE